MFEVPDRLDVDGGASAGCAGQESISRVADFAFDKTDSQASLFDPSLGGESLAFDRTHVLNLQVDCREVLTSIEHPSESDSHGGVGHG